MVGREEAALKMCRANNVTVYADYAEYLGLGRPKTFADISLQPKVQKALEELYGTVDRVELWVGLIAADHGAGGKIFSPVSDLCVIFRIMSCTIPPSPFFVLALIVGDDEVCSQ